MPLTDTAIRKAKSMQQAYKLPDEKGLFLLVHPNGSKYWRQKYRYLGKEKLLSFGVHPDVGLKDTREKRDASRKLLAQGVDPGENKKAVKAAKVLRAANSFETIAREWLEKNLHTWAVSHSSRLLQRLDNDAFPWIGGRPIAEITPPELLAVIRRIEDRGTLDTAHRVRGDCGQIFRYAIATGRAERDPSADLRGALPPITQAHFASITEPANVGE